VVYGDRTVSENHADILEILDLLHGVAADDEDARREHQQVWEHVKTLRRRIASFN